MMWPTTTTAAAAFVIIYNPGWLRFVHLPSEAISGDWTEVGGWQITQQRYICYLH